MTDANFLHAFFVVILVAIGYAIFAAARDIGRFNNEVDDAAAKYDSYWDKHVSQAIAITNREDDSNDR